MTKKYFRLISLIAAVLLLGIALFYSSGCGATNDTATATTTTVATTTTSTSTTTTTMAQATINQSKAKAGAFFASSGTGIAGVAEDAASLSSTASGLGIQTVTAAGLPNSFYSAPDASGYYIVEGFHPSETVQVRYITQGETVVVPSWLATKSLATFEGYDWDSEFATPRVMVNTSQVTAWAANPTYKTVATFADYIVWSHIANAEEAGYRATPAMNILLADNHWIIPTYEASDRVSSMEAVVTISGSDVDGVINMDMVLNDDSDQYAAPVSGIGTGTLTIVTGETTVTLESTMAITFASEGVYDTLSLTGTTPDNYTVAVNCIADGSGTGTVSDESGTLVATMEISATVNSVTTVEVWGVDGSYVTFNL